MMQANRRHRIALLALVLLLPVVVLLHAFSGQISISAGEFVDALFHFDPENSHHLIARELRIPRLFTAFIAGSALSVAGLLMQTLFNNPLAGPYVLGINSGSGLFVAFSFMTGIPFLTSDMGTISSALLGAFLFGLLIMSFSGFIRSHISLLLVGLMLGSFTSAIIYILQTVSSAEELKAYTMWAMGSLQHTELGQIPLLAGIAGLAMVSTFVLVKPLNALVLGERDAALLGIQLRTVRMLIIALTAVLTGIVTAYCGPVAFVGLAIPNLVRILFKTQQHRILILACLLTGGIFLVICDAFLQWMEQSVFIPINALTSLIGAPFVVFIVLKRMA
jgi:iron complex transport system permease protein